MISLSLDQKTESLKQDFQNWLKSNKPPESEGKQSFDDFVQMSSAWQKSLADERWIGVHWPEAYGGRGLSLLQEAVLQECLAAVRAPQLVNLLGLTMVGPVLIEHGTPEQKERFLKNILTAEEIWCQGFSEPEAGSDLAAVSTSAEKTDGGWSITGQKVWTSFAQYASWCFVLARTEKGEKKHKGLSYFLIPMDQKGIEVRPLTQISGDQEFNEIFFDKANTEDKYLVGQPGDGWKIAISTLMYERVILTFARHLQSEQALNEIRDVLRGSNASSADIAHYGRLVAKSMAVRSLALSHLITYDKSSPGPEGSFDKLAWSETFQEICKFALSLQGPNGVLDGLQQHRYLYSRGRTIAAGSSEIQRNIIAERVLGLPRA